MRNRTRMIATAAAVTAALAAGSGAAVASATGAKPGAPAKTVSASGKPGGPKAADSKAAEERQGHDAMTAGGAPAVRVRTRPGNAAWRPLLAAGPGGTPLVGILAAAPCRRGAA